MKKSDRIAHSPDGREDRIAELRAHAERANPGGIVAWEVVPEPLGTHAHSWR